MGVAAATLIAVIVLLTQAPPSLGAQAPVPVFKCAAAKNKAAGKYLECRAKAEASFIGSFGANPAKRATDLARCLADFSKTWDAIERKRYAVGCNGVLDFPHLYQLIDTCSDQSVVIILSTPPAALPPDGAKCLDKKAKAAGVYFKCIQKAEARFIKQGEGDLSRRALDRAKCLETLTKAWSKQAVLQNGYCQTTNLPQLQLKLDTCSADVVDGIVPQPNTATRTPTAMEAATSTPTAVSACQSPGERVGGYCWYLGAAGASCDATCQSFDLTCDVAGTDGFAGAGGTLAQCGSVVSALGFTGSVSDTTLGLGDPVGLGCFVAGNPLGSQNFRDISGSTRCDVGVSPEHRLCACRETTAACTNTQCRYGCEAGGDCMSAPCEANPALCVPSDGCHLSQCAPQAVEADANGCLESAWSCTPPTYCDPNPDLNQPNCYAPWGCLYYCPSGHTYCVSRNDGGCVDPDFVTCAYGCPPTDGACGYITGGPAYCLSWSP